jgi:hypothetical protein
LNTWQSAGERSRCASNDLLEVDQQLARRLDPVFISELSRTSIADEMREEHRRRVLGE